MRLDWNSRDLSDAEIHMALSVFDNSLPPTRWITITDGLGPLPTFDYPYTTNIAFTYRLHLGPDIYPDATLATVLPNFGRYCDIFIHEMTHVWQYRNGFSVVSGTIWANTFGAGYSYTIDDMTHGTVSMWSSKPALWKRGSITV